VGTAFRFHRLVGFLATGLFALTGYAQQTSTVSFTVSSDPPGARFAVDGVIYSSATSFQWPAGSQHLVRFIQDVAPPLPVSATDPSVPSLAGQLSTDGSIIYTLTGWSDSKGYLTPGSDPNQVVTADPSITSLTAKVNVNYRVYLSFFESSNPGLPSACGAPGPAPANDLRVGVVYVGSQCYWNNALLYFPANTQLTINAFPFPGFVFLGWSGAGTSNAYLTQFKLTQPIVLSPIFGPAKRVRFSSDPLGLQVMVDNTPTPTLSSSDPASPCPHNEGLPVTVLQTVAALCRGDFDFAPGSVHLVGAPSPQLDVYGKAWLFDSWGNGQGMNAAYTTDERTAVPDNVIVKFVRGAQASFLTQPLGLNLNIDQKSDWPSYNFVWGLGTSHQVTAPSQQFDSSGRQYTFRGWSNGGPQAQTVTVDQTAVDSGYRLTAIYDVLSRVVVQSVPAGTIQIDGKNCVTPCNVDRPAGSSFRVTTPTSIALGDGIRQDLAGWSDGGPADHTFSIRGDLQTLTANYTTLYRLTTATDPANGADLVFAPASPDLFYPAGTQVTITEHDRPGFKFRRWGWDLTGTVPTGTLTMNAPHALVALLDRVPYIPPAGVQNAAGSTPDAVVAPGSLISITGQSLVPDTVQGRVNPLAQTLDGATVSVNERLLPLVSVSPQSIVAQLPSDLPEGNYALLVHAQGQPDVTGNFTVARNAPGLFSVKHADGSMVTNDNPAQPGESVTILGTGFGPFARPIPDGFFPAAPLPACSDAVDVLVSSQPFQPDKCVAATGTTGMVALTLKIGNGMPGGTTADLTVRINGRLSNTISLPLQ
jgi:uncharacterized protein (TIGR03437 family)